MCVVCKKGKRKGVRSIEGGGGGKIPFAPARPADGGLFSKLGGREAVSKCKWKRTEQKREIVLEREREKELAPNMSKTRQKNKTLLMGAKKEKGWESKKRGR